MADPSVEVARAIVEFGNSNNAWEGDLPEHDADWVVGANELIGVASSAAEGGIRSFVIKEILFLAHVDPVYKEVCEERGVPYEHAQTGGASASAFAQGPEASPDTGDDFDVNSIIPGYDDLKVAEIKAKIAQLPTAELVDAVKAYEDTNEGRRGIMEYAWKPPAPAVVEPVTTNSPTTPPADGGANLRSLYEDGQIGVQRMIAEGLTPPAAITSPTPALEQDITDVSAQDLSRFAMGFHSHFARAAMLMGREEARASVCDTISRDARADAFKRSFATIKSGLDKQTGAAITEARQEAEREADSDTTYRLWRDRRVEHEAEARVLKGVIAGYDSAIDRISREQSRREKLAAGGTS